MYIDLEKKLALEFPDFELSHNGQSIKFCIGPLENTDYWTVIFLFTPNDPVKVGEYLQLMNLSEHKGKLLSFIGKKQGVSNCSNKILQIQVDQSEVDKIVFPLRKTA